MSWRSTITYWVVFAILGTYYLAVEYKAPTRADLRFTREKVLNIFSDEVTAVTLHRDGNAIRCERREKRWQIVKPDGAKVPADLIAALIENLTDKQEAEEINAHPKPEELQSFGLSDSSPALDVEVAGGKTLTVKFGGRNPPQTAFYAQTSVSPRVLLVGVNVEYYADLLYEAGTQGAKRAATTRS